MWEVFNVTDFLFVILSGLFIGRGVTDIREGDTFGFALIVLGVLEFGIVVVRLEIAERAEKKKKKESKSDVFRRD